jgi:hypothetical protein
MVHAQMHVDKQSTARGLMPHLVARNWLSSSGLLPGCTVFLPGLLPTNTTDECSRDRANLQPPCACCFGTMPRDQKKTYK